MAGLRLFRSVRIIDGAVSPARIGDVLLRGNSIAKVSGPEAIECGEGTQVIDGLGLTLMPGMCDAHSHLGLINADYFSMTAIAPEKHFRIACKNAEKVLRAGFTMCLGAGASKEGQDIALRNAIQRGQVKGPRLLACGEEISMAGSYVDPAQSNFDASPAVIVSGPERVAAEAARICSSGVDILKLGMSGDNGTPHAPSHSTAMSEAEVEAAVSQARSRGVRVNAHARSAEAVRLCLRFGVELISHADLIDEAEIEELGRRRDEFFVVPAMGYLARALEGCGESIGFTSKMARRMGFEEELEKQIAAMKRLKALGVRILTGGDYGFAWTPHGTNARDLEDFVNFLGYTPLEAIAAATSLGALAMRTSEDLGKIAPGYLADLLLIRGDPLEDISILQDEEKLVGVMKDGDWVKSPVDANGDLVRHEH